MDSSITIDGVTVSGTLEDMTKAYDSVRSAIATGETGTFALDTRDGDYTIRQMFLITPNSHLSASLAYSPIDELPTRQPTP